MTKHRGHGEGHIGFHRPSGKWRAAVDLGIVNGKRKRKYVYGDTRKAATVALRAIHQEQDDMWRSAVGCVKGRRWRSPGIELISATIR